MGEWKLAQPKALLPVCWIESITSSFQKWSPTCTQRHRERPNTCCFGLSDRILSGYTWIKINLNLKAWISPPVFMIRFAFSLSPPHSPPCVLSMRSPAEHPGEVGGNKESHQSPPPALREEQKKRRWQRRAGKDRPSRDDFWWGHRTSAAITGPPGHPEPCLYSIPQRRPAGTANLPDCGAVLCKRVKTSLGKGAVNDRRSLGCAAPSDILTFFFFFFYKHFRQPELDILPSYLLKKL